MIFFCPNCIDKVPLQLSERSLPKEKCHNLLEETMLKTMHMPASKSKRIENDLASTEQKNLADQNKKKQQKCFVTGSTRSTIENHAF